MGNKKPDRLLRVGLFETDSIMLSRTKVPDPVFSKGHAKAFMKAACLFAVAV